MWRCSWCIDAFDVPGGRTDLEDAVFASVFQHLNCFTNHTKYPSKKDICFTPVTSNDACLGIRTIVSTVLFPWRFWERLSTKHGLEWKRYIFSSHFLEFITVIFRGLELLNYTDKISIKKILLDLNFMPGHWLTPLISQVLVNLCR